MAKKQIKKLPPKLKIDRDINDEDIWFVEIHSKKINKKISCRLESLNDKFSKQDEDWNVTVLGVWREGDSKRFEKFD